MSAPVEGLPEVEDPLRRSVHRLISLRRPEGHYEGFSDAGVAFDAANLVLARFVGDQWPQESQRVVDKLRHVLAGQSESGLFQLYPEGPCSVEATRIVCMAIDCVTRTAGSSLPSEFVEQLQNARQSAREAIRNPGDDHFELAYLLFFRLTLEALDDNAPDRRLLAPSPTLALLLPVMFVGLLPRALWRRVDRVLYPFIAVLPQLLSFSGWRAVETSRIGVWMARALERLPGTLRRMKARAGRGVARWLLARQDATGGFYYSAIYSFLFVAALRNAVDIADSRDLDEQGTSAARRALDYVRARESVVSTGISTSFVASDVWDTAAVATSLLEAPAGTVPDGMVNTLGRYVLAQQSPSGGFSYGRGSQYPDVDTTGLAMGLLAALLSREPAMENREAMLTSLARAFDFLAKHRSKEGGFNAWTIRHGAVPPPMPSDMTSLLFDVSSTDVTARVMLSLGRVLDLGRTHHDAAESLGVARLRRAEDLRKSGVAYLRSARDRASGLWPARWTLGYIIGTRFVFDALDTYPELAGELPALRNDASRTLLACQNPDGGFGESPESDTKSRFTPSPRSAALVTAAALGILREARVSGASEGAARAFAYIVRAQKVDGSWPELSFCTQFAGLYASYELMTQVALVTTLFRVARSPRRERDTEL